MVPVASHAMIEIFHSDSGIPDRSFVLIIELGNFTFTYPVDPFLTGGNQTYNSSIYDDLSLVFVLYFKKGYKPTETSHDFNCTLPVIYYDLDENTTVALGMCYL